MDDTNESKCAATTTPQHSFLDAPIGTNMRIAALAAAHHVSVGDLWVPVVAVKGSKGSIIFDPETPIALLDHKTASVTFRRDEIMSTLKLIGSVMDMNIPERVIESFAAAYTLFVRLNPNEGRRKAPTGRTVLVRRMTNAEAVAEGSAFPARPGSISVVEPIMPSGSLPPKSKVAASAAGRSTRSAVKPSTGVRLPEVAKSVVEQAIDEMFEAHLKAAKAERVTSCKRPRQEADETATQEMTLPERFLRGVTSARSDTSSHGIPFANTKSLCAGAHSINNKDQGGIGGDAYLYVNGKATMWSRPSAGTLIYRHLPEANRDAKNIRSIMDRLFAPRSMVAFLPIEGLLLPKQETPVERLKQFLETGDSSTTCDVLHDARVADRIRKLSERGYKIVMFEHYPQLHFGDEAVLARVAKRIVTFLEANCPLVPVTVVLSVVSWFSGAQYANCLPPENGVYNTFVLFNGNFHADPSKSLIVARKEEMILTGEFSEIAVDLEKRFALNCRKGIGMRLVPADEFLEWSSPLFS